MTIVAVILVTTLGSVTMGTDDRQIVLSREELDERVWSTPTRRLAGKFGL